MKDWTSIDNRLPELGQFVITSVKSETYIYHEILKIDENTKKWVNHDGNELRGDISVIGWLDLPPSFLG